MKAESKLPDFQSGLFDDRIPYIKIGSGPRKLVYCSGGGALLQNIVIDPIPRVRAKAPLLAPDQTIFILGYPSDLKPDIAVEELADDFAVVIQKYVGKSIIIGNSFGGMVAIPFAAKYPQLTEKLILTSSAYRFSASYATTLQKSIENAEKGHILNFMVRMHMM